ncbi:DUF1642 domain-containing protein [Aerococcus viridans]
MKIEIDKPVIPQFVADYLRSAKADITFMRVMELAKTRNELLKWKKEYDWISANDEIFATAWIHGYEVEKEPFYYAKIKGWEHVGTSSYYFGYDEDNDSLEVTYLEGNYHFAFSLTKEHWNKLGINETNADFEVVSE